MALLSGIHLTEGPAGPAHCLPGPHEAQEEQQSPERAGCRPPSRAARLPPWDPAARGGRGKAQRWRCSLCQAPLHPRAQQSPPPLGRLHVGTSDARRSPRAPQSGGRCGGSRWRELVWQASVLVTLPGRWEGCPHSSAWPSGPLRTLVPSTGTLLSPEARCGCVCEHRRRPRQAPGPVAGQAASAPSCVEATLPEPSREQGAISA